MDAILKFTHFFGLASKNISPRILCMCRAAKNMFKCYRSTVPSGLAAFQTQSRNIRERERHCWISPKRYLLYLFPRNQRSYLKYNRPPSTVATIFSKRIKERNHEEASEALSSTIYSHMHYGYIHPYTDPHLPLDWSGLTWFLTIYRTNIRTNCPMQKVRNK